MGYNQSWEWEMSIADASLFAAWSREVELQRAFFTLPGLLIPASVSFKVIHGSDTALILLAKSKSGERSY